MTIPLPLPLAIRRCAWLTSILSLASLVGGLIGMAIGNTVHEETLLMPCSVLIASAYGIQPNMTRRRVVLFGAVSVMLTAVGFAFLALRAVV